VESGRAKRIRWTTTVSTRQLALRGDRPGRGDVARIYLSATYGDLREDRENAYQGLRQLGHDVVAMETTSPPTSGRSASALRKGPTETYTSGSSPTATATSPRDDNSGGVRSLSWSFGLIGRGAMTTTMPSPADNLSHRTGA
jgi:Domain of unknown function (DUF4062)